MALAETTTLNGGPDFEVALVAELGALAPLRREVAQRLAAQDVPSEKVDDIVLVLCELATNAIRATEPSDAPIRVRVQFGDATVAVAVENSGPAFDAVETVALGHPGADTESGRGLGVVRALSDDVSVHSHAGCCIVRAIITTGSRSNGSPG